MDAVKWEVADFLSENKFGGTLDGLYVNNGLILAHCFQMFYKPWKFGFYCPEMFLIAIVLRIDVLQCY